jgi:hypothetical protein
MVGTYPHHTPCVRGSPQTTADPARYRPNSCLQPIAGYLLTSRGREHYSHLSSISWAVDLFTSSTRDLNRYTCKAISSSTSGCM